MIGAGAAGLYAADILRSKGVNVTIFEARDQMGGRVVSFATNRKINIRTFPCLALISRWSLEHKRSSVQIQFWGRSSEIII
ncbi:MAG: NAD(P)-binding protein [Bacteroidota bacterium]